MKLPALPLGTCIVLAAFLLCVFGLTVFLISRGNVQLETTAGLVLVTVLGTAVAFMRGLQPTAAPEASKPPPQA